MAYFQSPLNQPNIYPFVRRMGVLREYPTRTEADYTTQKKGYGVMLALSDDIFFAAAMGLVALAHGRLNKIIGSRPGRMKSLIEETLKSDFRAGHSYFPRENKSAMMLFRRYLGNIGKFGSRNVVATVLTGSLLLGTYGTAKAGDIIPIGQKVSATVKSEKLRSVTDYVAGLTEKTSQNVKNISDLLYRTAIHESGGLRYERSLSGGPERGPFQIRPTTAKNMINWSKNYPDVRGILEATSKKPYRELSKITEKELSNMLLRNDLFSASIARIKYMTTLRGKVPVGEIEDSIAWANGYWAGKKNLRPLRASQFLKSNNEFAIEESAAYMSNVMKPHTMIPPKTHGLVNDVLHNNKIKHNIASQDKFMGPIKNAIREVSKLASRR